MLLSELKEKIINGTFDIEELKIKTYLPIIHKQAVVSQVCNSAIAYDNGIAYVDIFAKEITTIIAVLLGYCELSVDDGISDEEIVEIIDLLLESGIYKNIQEAIGRDLDELTWFILEEIENIKYRNNSIEAVLSKTLNNIVETVPIDKEIAKVIKKASKDLQKVDYGQVLTSK